MQDIVFVIVQIIHDIKCTLRFNLMECSFFVNRCTWNNIIECTAHSHGNNYRNGTLWPRLCFIGAATHFYIKLWLQVPLEQISQLFYVVNLETFPAYSNKIITARGTFYGAAAILMIWGQIMSLAVLTIWARGVGPRFRPDQLSDLTWKDLLIFLSGILVLVISVVALF